MDFSGSIPINCVNKGEASSAILEVTWVFRGQRRNLQHHFLKLSTSHLSANNPLDTNQSR